MSRFSLPLNGHINHTPHQDVHRPLLGATAGAVARGAVELSRFGGEMGPGGPLGMLSEKKHEQLWKMVIEMA